MQFPVNLVIELRSQDEHDAIQDIIDTFRKSTESITKSSNSSDLFTGLEVLNRANYQLVDGTKEARVTISGLPIAVGTKEEMIGRYRTECAMHRSNVVLEHWLNGNYQVIQARRLQKI